MPKKMTHISEVLSKKTLPKKGKATVRRKQGKKGVKSRKVVMPAVEVYAVHDAFVLPKPEKKKKGEEGRPTVMTQDVVRKLESAFVYDCTVEEACLEAGIAKSTYYKFLEEHPTFSDRVDRLRNAPNLVIRKKLIQESAHNADLGLKYLERKNKVEFSTRAEIAHSGEVINRHHIDPEQEALIKKAMGNFARKVNRDAEKKS